MKKLVSIIIPCYNQAKYVEEALISVLNQTYTCWECIIVDDGSADNSDKIIKNFISEDSRFNYIHKINEGVSKARNVGLENVKGEYIQFLDADDILDENKLELSLNELLKKENEGVKMIISNFQMISHDSKKKFKPYCTLDEKYFSVDGFLTHWNISFSIQMNCGFFDASLFEKIRFSENLSAQEDWVVWVQLFKNDNKFVFLDIPLAFYRINPESRMNTLGIDDNQLKVISNFKEILTFEEFYKFSFTLINKYYSSDTLYRNNLNKFKKSNSYLTGKIIRKIFKTLGILKYVKLFFESVIKNKL